MTRGLSHPGSTVGRPLNREIHLAGDILSGLVPAPRIVSSIMVMSWGTPFTYRVALSPEIRISRLPHERLIAFFSSHSSISYFSVSCFTFPFPTLLHSPVTHRISSSRIRPVPLPPENRPPVSAGEFKVSSCRLYYGRFRNSGEIFPASGEYAPQFPCADFQAEAQLSEEIPESGDNPVP